MAVSGVFRGAPKVALAEQGTLLEALQAGIAGRVAVLENPAATGAGRSAMGLLGVSAGYWPRRWLVIWCTRSRSAGLRAGR
jgi:hypothetical protein